MKTVFATYVGSQLYGTATPQSDKDFKGFCFEDHDQIIGLKTFEQQEYNNGDPDGPTKMEGTIYSIRRYINLCLKGNPTVIEIAFADPKFWMFNNRIGLEVVEYVKNNFLTKALFKPYSAYHMAQLRKLQSMERTGKRAELVKEFGYDPKFAGHAYRLARQCCIVMREGILRPTLDPDDRIMCLDIRNGKYPKEEVLNILTEVDKDMYVAYKDTTLPEAPDFNRANIFVSNQYLNYLRGDYDNILNASYFKPF